MDAMSRAHALAQAGDLMGAAELCRGVIAREPGNFYALFMLGTIEGEFRQFKEAEKHLARAVKLNPSSAEALTSYGNILIEQKRHRDAVATLGKAISLQPQNSNALIYRGLALAELGRHEEALKDFDRVLQLDPRSAFALNNRANSLIALNRHQEAWPSVDALLRLAPNHVPGLASRAVLLTSEKKHREALAVLERALAIEPNNPDLILARGHALMALQRYEDALAAFRKAAASKPDSSDAHLACANALMELNRLEEALASCETSIAARADYAPGLLLRGNILLHLGRAAEALAAYDRAVAAKPDYAESQYHRGSALLLGGRFKEGWRDFERRWEAGDCGFDRPRLRAREWRDEPLSGRSIVVYSEQGLGDAIQFARFMPRLTAMGAKVTFLCHPNLVRLFRPVSAHMEVIAFCDPDRRFDFQCALMSLAERFRIDLRDLPGEVPYLFPEAPLVAQWRARVGDAGYRIGISWQGNPIGVIDRGRSIPLEQFRPLAELPGVRLISLQKTHGLDQLAHLPEGMIVEALGAFDEGPDAFIDTAAIMASLDLIVTSDTATAHLAGALGRPAWVALKHVPDWRWMLAREDSPWYPSLRLFRQPARGEWTSVFAAMAEALRPLVEREPAP
jgi:tetratricopeptide (TPR) repeat protein